MNSVEIVEVVDFNGNIGLVIVGNSEDSPLPSKDDVIRFYGMSKSSRRDLPPG